MAFYRDADGNLKDSGNAPVQQQGPPPQQQSQVRGRRRAAQQPQQQPTATASAPGQSSPGVTEQTMIARPGQQNQPLTDTSSGGSQVAMTRSPGQGGQYYGSGNERSMGNLLPAGAQSGPSSQLEQPGDINPNYTWQSPGMGRQGRYGQPQQQQITAPPSGPFGQSSSGVVEQTMTARPGQGGGDWQGGGGYGQQQSMPAGNPNAPGVTGQSMTVSRDLNTGRTSVVGGEPGSEHRPDIRRGRGGSPQGPPPPPPQGAQGITGQSMTVSRNLANGQDTVVGGSNSPQGGQWGSAPQFNPNGPGATGQSMTLSRNLGTGQVSQVGGFGQPPAAGNGASPQLNTRYSQMNRGGVGGNQQAGGGFGGSQQNQQRQRYTPASGGGF